MTFTVFTLYRVIQIRKKLLRKTDSKVMIRMLFFAMSLSMTTAFASINESATLTWGYVDFAPYHYSVKGRVVGLQAERIDAIFKEHGIDYRPFALPVKRAKLYIEQGNIDFTTVIESFIATPAKFLKSERPFYNIILGAICLKQHDDITTLDDLKDIPLIVISGYTYGDEREIDETNGFDVPLTALNHEHAIKALTYKRADCVLGYAAPFSVEKIKYPDTKFYFHELSRLPVYVYLNAKVDNAQAIMQMIDSRN